MATPHRIIAWAEADQVSLIEDAMRADALELLAVGSDGADDGAKLSNALHVPRVDDLRKAIAHDQNDLLWIAGRTPIDGPLLKLIRERNVRTLTTEPHPGSLADLAATADEAAPVSFVPLMRRSPGYRAALDVLEDFGEPRCVNITMRSGPGQGSLFARMFDAVDIIESLCGDPEIIDAALVNRAPSVAERLSDLHGHMTSNMRFSENRCACVAASDCAGSWFRGVTVLGDGGCLRISDDGFEWVAENGELIDSHTSAAPTTPGSLIATHMLRVLGNLDATDAPPDAGRLLAICEAARLSSRTGEGETPRKVQKMLSHL